MSSHALRALLFGITLAACDEPPRPPAEGASGATVLDDVGQSVVVARAPRRVVSLVPSITDVILALDAGDRLIARTDYDSDARLAELPSVGGGLTPNIEWLAAQRPDLIFSWADRSSRSIAGRLSGLGIPTYAARVETLDDIRRTIRNAGVLLDRAAAADTLLRSIDAALDAVATATRGSARPRVLYVIAVDPPIVAGPRTYIDELIAIAGGENVAADAGAQWPQLSLEELVRRDPEVVVWPQGAGAAPPLEQLRTLPGWSRFTAVRQGRVHGVAADRFNRPGPAVAEVARELAALFHGDAP